VILRKSAYYRSYKADGDFSKSKKRSKSGIKLICELREPLNFGGSTIVKKFCSAVKQGSQQIRNCSDN